MSGGPAPGPPLFCCAHAPEFKWHSHKWKGAAPVSATPIFSSLDLDLCPNFFELTGPVRASIAAAQCNTRNTASRERTPSKKIVFSRTFFMCRNLTVLWTARFFITSADGLSKLAVRSWANRPGHRLGVISGRHHKTNPRQRQNGPVIFGARGRLSPFNVLGLTLLPLISAVEAFR